jgi:FMN phosphatase YigB (HAD superfamily)
MSEPRLLTRAELAAKVKDWQQARISSADLHAWASELYHPEKVRYEDWDRYEGDEESVSATVLQDLDLLNMNLAQPEDALIYLAFLATPRGQFGDGYRRYRDRLKAIDYAARRKKLAADPLYAPFCKGSA